MRSFDRMNPAAVSVHLLLTAALAMFSDDPILVAVSLVCALLYSIVRNGFQNMTFHAYMLGFSIVIALLNPLWNQRGETVILFINSRAVTLEAFSFGIISGLRFAAVVTWLKIFSDYMNSERMFYLLRHFSPKIAMIFTLSLRNLTVYRQQFHKIQQSQKALGLYKEDHWIDDLRGGLRVFSVLITWALENGIVISNSMQARGYGSGRRTSFSYYRWCSRDVLFLFLVLCSICVYYYCNKFTITAWQYYPIFKIPVWDLSYFAKLILYLIIALIPVICEGGERLKWKFLRSKI